LPDDWHFVHNQPHYHLPTGPARAAETTSASMLSERIILEGVDPVTQQLRLLQQVSNVGSEFARAPLIKLVDLRHRYPHKFSKILYELPVRVGELQRRDIPQTPRLLERALQRALASLPRTDARAPL